MKPEKIYLIGICGTAMGALAAMLKELGHQVVGSDTGVYPPISDFLAERKIEVLAGFTAEHLDQVKPDLVVVGNVVRRVNPEARRLFELGLPYLSLPQALNRFFLADRESVVAAGTHGKTTTTALLAWLLHRAGLDPSFLVGGISRDFEANYRLGQGRHFVIEGDEYDTAFFDKVPKFIHYKPLWSVLTSVEFDHADIYPDFAAVKAAFARFVDLIPPQGRLMVFDGCPEALDLAARAACPVIRYGFRADSLVRPGRFSLGPGRVSFELIYRDRNLGRFDSPLPGRHNLANGLAALGLLLEMGLEPDVLRAGLADFKGVKRRQEVLAMVDGVMVMDDFAHHPTAVKETLAAIRSFYPDRRLVTVFEPRTNTSRRKVFQADYAEAFNQAQVVLIRQAPGLETLAEEERFSSRQLVDDLKKRGLAARFFSETDSLLEGLLETARSGDLVAILSNGGFDGLHRRFIQKLRERSAPRPVRT